MNAFSRSLRAMLAAGVLAVPAAGAAPRAVESFDVSTWPTLTQMRRPAAVVFTTTDCTHCPAVIAHLAAEFQRLAFDGSLYVVVMDGEPDVAAHPHYQVADRLFVFAGQGHRIRHTVDPTWRGMTPYVALLSPGHPIVWVLGRPSPDQLRAWTSGAAPAIGK